MRRPDPGILFGFILYGIICFQLFYDQSRENFSGLILSYSLLFALYGYLIWRSNWLKHDFQVNLLIGGAIGIRVLGLLAVPGLSDDIFRFIWDGNLSLQGINPFLFTPAELMQAKSQLSLDSNLFGQMNSPEYHTVYPPVLQGIFMISAWIGGSSVFNNTLVLKIIVLIAEIGVILQLRFLLKHFKKSQFWILIYALNPLIVLELSGNLHFEAVMIFFLLLSWRWFLQENWLLASLAFAFAVNTKLLPLILLPYLLLTAGRRRIPIILGMLVGVSLVMWFPFLKGEEGLNLFSSLDLYFRKFEFNASLYYLFRWIGFEVKGYNIIQSLGPALGVISTLLILGISVHFRGQDFKNFPIVLILTLTLYYLFSTTVHPWYITPMIAFLPFTGRVYPLVWSFLIFLSYQAYGVPDFTENPYILTAEYGLLYGIIILEWWRDRKNPEDKTGMLQGLLS